MKKYKVCHITTVHPEDDNRIFYKQCRSLAAAGFKVYFMCSGSTTCIKDDIQIIGLAKYSNRILNFIRCSVVDVIKTSIRLNADIYQIHDPELVFSGIFLRLIGKKVIYDIHEDNSSSILSKPYFKSTLFAQFISWLVNIFEKICVLFFSQVITARPDITEKFQFVHPITVNNFPIVENLLPNKAKNNLDKTILIYVGGITKIRGILELIQSLEYLTDTELWLLGPWESKSFNLTCEQLPGWKKTRYLGTVKPFEIFEYLQQADIGIITFWPVPNHLKTLANKPFEYMLAGLPVVMSNFPYWQSFFGKVAKYANPKDPKSIAEGIKSLKNNPELRQELGNNGRLLVQEKLNWNVESQKLIELYKSLITL
ncbi:MAG: glycosyltransferase [Flavobacteriaceae bacterium]